MPRKPLVTAAGAMEVRFRRMSLNYNGEDAKKVKEVMDKERLLWRSFVDKGPIAGKWKPAGTPSFYVLDPKGVIRYKWAGAPGEKAIDSALHKLILEAAIEPQ